MSSIIPMDQAKEIMGSNFIGPDELSCVGALELLAANSVPDVPYSNEFLEARKDSHLLVLGQSVFSNGDAVTIRNIRKFLGMNPDVFEPCFYNQDWYENEPFIDVQMNDKWFLIRKNVYEDSRAVSPDDLFKMYRLPSAIDCVYAFFMAWFTLNVKLWYHDFVWCSDVDHNGDRIYVGKYSDVDGVNKNGFSIHRHLSIRPCYGCVDLQ